MIGFAPVLRSVTVVAAPGATTSKRTGATCRDAAEAPLAATQPGSKRTPKARDIFVGRKDEDLSVCDCNRDRIGIDGR